MPDRTPSLGITNLHDNPYDEVDYFYDIDERERLFANFFKSLGYSFEDIIGPDMLDLESRPLRMENFDPYTHPQDYPDNKLGITQASSDEMAKFIEGWKKYHSSESDLDAFMEYRRAKYDTDHSPAELSYVGSEVRADKLLDITGFGEDDKPFIMDGRLAKSAILNKVLGPYFNSVIDVGAQVADELKEGEFRTGTRIGARAVKHITDFASGIAAAPLRVLGEATNLNWAINKTTGKFEDLTGLSIATNLPEDRLSEFNSAILGANIPEGSNYAINLIDHLFGPEGIAGPLGAAEKLTGWANDALQEEYGFTDSEWSKMAPKLQTGGDVIELAAFLASGRAINTIVRAPYKWGYKGAIQGSVALNVSRFRKTFDERMKSLQNAGASQAEMNEAVKTYLDSILKTFEGGLIRNKDGVIVGAGVKGGNTLGTNAKLDILNGILKREFKHINENRAAWNANPKNIKAPKYKEIIEGEFEVIEEGGKFVLKTITPKQITGTDTKLIPKKPDPVKEDMQTTAKNLAGDEFFYKTFQRRTDLRKNTDNLKKRMYVDEYSKDLLQPELFNYHNIRESAGPKIGFYDGIPNKVDTKYYELGSKDDTGNYIISPQTPIQLYRGGKIHPNKTSSFVWGNEEWKGHLDYLLKNHLEGRARNKGEFGTNSIMAHLGLDYTNILKVGDFNRAIKDYYGISPGGKIPYEGQRPPSYSWKLMSDWKKNPEKYNSTKEAVKHYNYTIALIQEFNKLYPKHQLSLDHIYNIARTRDLPKDEKGQFLEKSNHNVLYTADNRVAKNRVLELTNSGFGRILKNIEKFQKDSAFNKKVTVLGEGLRSQPDKVFSSLEQQVQDFKTLWSRWQEVASDKNIKWTLKDDAKFTKENVSKFLDETNPEDKKIMDEIFDQTKVTIDNTEQMDLYIDFLEKMIKAKDNNPGFKFKQGGAVNDTPINRNEPKRGAVTGPGRYSVDKKYDPGTIFGQYLTAKSETFEKRRMFKELPEAMKGPMSVFLADEERLARVREAAPEVRYKTEEQIISLKDIKKQIADELIDDKPVKFKWRNIPEAIQRNPIYRSITRDMQLPFMLMGAIGNDIKNSFNGTDQEFNENFPVLSALVAPQIEKAWMPTPSTDNEAAYIDGFAEINRALDTGITNLGFNTMDLVLGGIDLLSFGKTDLSGRLRKLYDEKAINEPETFLGDMLTLLVEFGVPGGLVTKILTRAQKALRIKGVNTMTRFIDDDVYGAARFGMQMSNISKKMGTGAIIFGATDLLAGGPYNSLHRMFPEDPTLLPGKPIETKDLSGNELALANFKNRIRFAGDGAMIGGLFPLLGPAAWAATKWTAKLPFKTIPGIDRSVVGGALQIAGIPLKIAADTLAGKLAYTQKTLPVIGEGIQKLGQWGAKGIQETAKFLGKQVFTRAALAAYDAAYAKQAAYSGIKFDKTFKRSLPDFQKWREFSVNSQDPLHQYLARIDNKLASFRDIGKLTRDAFGISGQTNLFIKAKSRVVDKYLKSIEEEAYKMAKAFEDRHKNWGEYQTIQRKYLDDVLDYLQGTVKADALPLRLRELAVSLKEYTNGLKKEFGELLPQSDPLKYLLSADIDRYMRRSFAMFTNADFQPGREAVLNAKAFVKDVIRGNEGFVMQAREAFPDQPIAKAIDEYAELKVADIMHTARYEMADPFKALEKIVNKKLGMGDIRITTGEEVPAAIRKLLGEEKNLKSSLLQTTGNMIASTQQKTALDRLAKMGLENGWLFNTAEEALAKGKIYNAARLTDVKGTGFLINDAIGLYGTPEMVRQLSGYSIFDSALKYKVYQNLLAFKAMVQGGKTLYSPATQMRNFGSASLFAMNVGHIGGSASVPQAMKIVLDDIFGSGPKVNKNDLIKYIERKVELGVTDENVVANELAGILADLKGTRSATGEPIISSFNQLLQKVGNTQMSQYVQRTYAGGDNVWKIYGHEFYMSELKQFTKSIDDVKKYFRDIVGREFVELSPKTGIKKTVAEGIEEMGAYLVRETYPTYSRVPPVVQAIRKLPIGNFISFPAEMLRTSATTLSLSLKHIASGNPGLQAMGYRSLFGQFTTLYGVNESVKALGHYLTDVNPDMTKAYLEDLGPGFMQDHALVPLTNQDKKTGLFKAFNLSTYNPYAYVIDPVNGFLRELRTPRLVTEIDGEVYNRLFDAAGPLMAFLEPFTTEAIALEPAFDIWARQGRARDGSIIFSPSDDFGEKVEKSWNHFLGTIAPGFIRSSGQILDALSLDTKSGRVMQLGDVLIRLLGGSIMNVDPVAALDYKAIDIREIRSNAFKTEHFFSKENALERGPEVMAAEFKDIQNEALAAQFEVWKMFQQSLSSGLLTKNQIEKVLGKEGRNVPNLDRLMDGKFTPVSFSESGLRKRADDLYKEYKRNGIIIRKGDLKPFSKLRKIIRQMKRIKFEDLLDPNRDPMPIEPERVPSASGFESMISQNQVAPLPNTPTPDVSQVNLNQDADPQTGLTQTETALLSPSEKLIQQRQRGTV